ncbi:hypothetical protein [Helicobacter sp. T3_23-1056]
MRFRKKPKYLYYIVGLEILRFFAKNLKYDNLFVEIFRYAQYDKSIDCHESAIYYKIADSRNDSKNDKMTKK